MDFLEPADFRVSDVRQTVFVGAAATKASLTPTLNERREFMDFRPLGYASPSSGRDQIPQ
jgi:hypothetical protein